MNIAGDTQNSSIWATKHEKRVFTKEELEPAAIEEGSEEGKQNEARISTAEIKLKQEISEAYERKEKKIAAIEKVFCRVHTGGDDKLAGIIRERKDDTD